MTLASSQGATFGGLSGLTNIKRKSSRQDPTNTSNRIDASTLSLTTGSKRVYVDGLPDAGAAAPSDGITETVTVSFLSDSPPTANTTYSGYKCTEVETEYAVGELVKGTATFVKI